MKISDLKRKLQPGTKLLNTARAHKPEFIGSVVTVKQNTSLGLQLERDGKTFFMDWPEKNCFRGDELGFTILGPDTRMLVSYRFLPPPAHSCFSDARTWADGLRHCQLCGKSFTESAPLSSVASGGSPEAR